MRLVQVVFEKWSESWDVPKSKFDDLSKCQVLSDVSRAVRV